MEKVKVKVKKFVSGLDSEKFDMEMYRDILDLTIEYICGSIVMQNVNRTREFTYNGAFVEVNNKYKLLHIQNSKNLSFNRFYPAILNNIVDDYHFNYVDFSKAYKLIYSLVTELSGNAELILKKWLNYTYGNFISSKGILIADGEINNHITTIARDLMEGIYKKFGSDIIYVDTDSIFFNDNLGLVDYVDTLGYEYSIDVIPNLIMIAPKKYIIFSDDSLFTLRGIPSLKTRNLRDLQRDLKNLGF